MPNEFLHFLKTYILCPFTKRNLIAKFDMYYYTFNILNTVEFHSWVCHQSNIISLDH